MIVKADKFQAVILNKKESEANYKLTIDNNDIEFTESVSNLCSKAAMQVNALGRLQKYIGKSVKVDIVNSFIYANFNYWPLV